jgi:SAM-dependent methyltransferase
MGTMNELLSETPQTVAPAPVRLEWTPELVGRFWNYYGTRADLHSAYFSKWVGAALVEFVRRRLKRFGEIADYGAGPGYLLEHLLPHGEKCWALDFSEESLEFLASRLKTAPRFAGTRVIEEATRQSLRVDTAFCLETLEHLLPEQVDSTVGFLHDILRPGGHLVLTVPHAEALELGDVFCPGCGSVFHRWQHMSSWTAPRLEALLRQAGFETVFCGADDLGARQRELTNRAGWSGRLKQGLLTLIDTRSHVETLWRWCKRLVRGGPVPSGNKTPNLIYIGRRAD